MTLIKVCNDSCHVNRESRLKAFGIYRSNILAKANCIKEYDIEINCRDNTVELLQTYFF